jgi:hypothetical protein
MQHPRIAAIVRATARHCTADQAVLPSHIARLALWHTQRSAGGCSLAATQCVPQWRLDLRRVTLAHSDRHSCASSDQLELYCAAPGELFLTAVEKDGIEAVRPGRSRFKLNSSFPNHADSDRTMLSGRRQRRVIAAQAAPGGRLGWTLDRPAPTRSQQTMFYFGTFFTAPGSPGPPSLLTQLQAAAAPRLGP